MSFFHHSQTNLSCIYHDFLQKISFFLRQNRRKLTKITSFCKIATCLVLIIHFKGTEKGVGPMPKWARTYFIDGMAALLCVRVNIREHSDAGLLALDGKGSYNNMNLLNGGMKGNQGKEINMNDECKRETCYKEAEEEGLLALDGKGSYNNMNLLNGGMKGNQQKEINMNDECKRETCYKEAEEEGATMDTLVAEVRVITALINDQNRQDEIEEEWQILGKVFDRLFFIMFFIIFVVSSLVLLLPVYMDD